MMNPNLNIRSRHFSTPDSFATYIRDAMLEAVRLFLRGAINKLLGHYQEPGSASCILIRAITRKGYDQVPDEAGARPALRPTFKLVDLQCFSVETATVVKLPWGS